jgi:hypothetical protein
MNIDGEDLKTSGCEFSYPIRSKTGAHRALSVEPWQNLADNGITCEADLDWVVGYYGDYVSEPSYGVVDDPENETFAYFLLPKRGNYTYRYRLQQNVNERLKLFDTNEAENLTVRKVDHHLETHGLLITLTVDPNLYLGYGLQKAWKELHKHYNRFITAFRKKVGRVYVVRATQSHASGFPHLHLIAITERPFTVVLHGDKDGKVSYRLKSTKDREVIRSCWSRGYVDIKAIAKRKGEKGTQSTVRNYLFKDLLKSLARKEANRDDKDIQTLALTWYYGLQSYSVSGENMLEAIMSSLGSVPDLICVKSNSNQILPETPPKDWLGIVNIHFDSSEPPPFFIQSHKEALENGLDQVLPLLS